MDINFELEEIESLDNLEGPDSGEIELDDIDDNGGENPEESEDDSEIDELDSLEETDEDNEPQESVGDNEEEQNTEEETPESNEEGSSQFYSSIANALLEDGVLSSLTEDDIKEVDNPDDLKSLFKKQVDSLLDEQQKRVLEALNYNVEPSKIASYERTIQYLESLSEDDLKAEENEDIRKRLIYNQYIRMGKSHERALKEVERSFERGDDIEDAIEAYNDSLEFYDKAFKDELENAKKLKEEEDRRTKERAENIQKVFEEKDFYEKIGVSEKIGKQAFIDATNARYRNPETGEFETALQKAQREDEARYLRGISVAFTLTNGFKDFDKLFKGAANKQVKSKLAELEGKISPSSRGGLQYVGKNNKGKSTKITL
jgi:protein kinase domain containing protein